MTLKIRRLSAKETLEAIYARLIGDWDNPALVAFGALDIDQVSDVLRMIETYKEETEKC